MRHEHFEVKINYKWFVIEFEIDLTSNSKILTCSHRRPIKGLFFARFQDKFGG